ncbi:MAG: diguanylate cyclase, partial [Rhodospirillaceae bacterium]
RVMLAMTEDGAGVFTGSYAVGDKVRLAYADTDMLLDNGFTDAMHPDALEGLFVYSCGGRRAILGEATDQEIKPLEALATTGGFFTYGEFFTARSGSHEILNNTMTVLLLSESGPVLRQEPAPQTATTPTALQDNSFHFSVSDMYHSLSHFTREITQELFAFSAALERKNQELELLSVSDRLTGLYNRSKLDDVLAEELQRARRYGQTFSVILLDIDHFKSVNDTHGHQVGDDVLRALSQVLKDNCRLSDIVGRWGGEEFMVICPGTGLPGAKTLAETLRSRIAAHVCPIAGPRTASFGVTDYQEDAKLESIVERADKALYQAKEQGRNQVVAG